MGEEDFRKNKIVLMCLGNVPDGKEMRCAMGCTIPEGRLGLMLDRESDSEFDIDCCSN